MAKGKWIRIFEGSETHCPMWWAVQWDTQEELAWVMESYDQGKSWLTNCDQRSMAKAMQFVEDWIADNK